MTHDDVLALMEAIKAATGCPYAYHHFAEGESPDPPFLCFLYPDEAEFWILRCIPTSKPRNWNRKWRRCYPIMNFSTINPKYGSRKRRCTRFCMN